MLPLNNIQQIKSIGIIGGGSSGYFTALYLKKKFPDKEITLVESPNIPIIGVGEATTPTLLNFLHQNLGISIREFFKETKPTLKLGIRFQWGKPGEYYYNDPFGLIDVHNALYYSGNINYCSLSSMMMDTHKAPFYESKEGIKAIDLPQGFAYHIDNKRLIKFLKTKLSESNCRYISTNIVRCNKTKDNRIESLVNSENELLDFNLYIDCTGFSSFLLGKALNTKWIDFSATLKTNRAIIGVNDHDGKIKPYTSATTLKHGWLWNTPTQTEDHLGYVFSKDFCSDDEAFSELKNHCHTINNEKVISFKPGRYEKNWAGNVVAIGNSYAFVEPLESTGIHMILQQIKNLKKILEKEGNIEDAKLKFNKKMADSWDFIKWFIGVHFKFNKRLSTPFWQDCQKNIDISGVQDYINYYTEFGPINDKKNNPIYQQLHKDKVFGAYSFDIHMAGCGVNETYFLENKKSGSEKWPFQLAIHKALVEKALPHERALKLIEEEQCFFLEKWYKVS